jgi:hypothetical protein
VIDFQLEAPDGSRITPLSGPAGANSQFVLSRYASYYRCALPVLPANAGGSHEGLWYAILKLGRPSPGSMTHNLRAEYNAAYYDPKRAVLPYEFVAHVYSSLTFSAHASQTSFAPGALVKLTASLLEYDAPLERGASVWAEIVRPDGITDFVPLPGDAGGQYTASYELQLTGVYAIRVRARGETARGLPFEREQTFTATAVPGGDIWSPNDPKSDPLCELLHCLGGRTVINEELARRLKELGIDLYALLKCLDTRCRSTAGEIETRQPQRISEAPDAQLTGVSLERLRQIISELLDERARGPS